MKKLILLLLCACSYAQTVNNARMLSGVNLQPGPNYTFVAADSTRVVVFSNLAMTAALPSGLTFGFGAGFEFDVQNLSISEGIISCQGCLIFSAASLAGNANYFLSSGAGVQLFSAGQNYYALSSGGGAGGLLNPAIFPGMAQMAYPPYMLFPPTQTGEYIGLGFANAFGNPMQVSYLQNVGLVANPGGANTWIMTADIGVATALANGDDCCTVKNTLLSLPSVPAAGTIYKSTVTADGNAGHANSALQDLNGTLVSSEPHTAQYYSSTALLNGGTGGGQVWTCGGLGAGQMGAAVIQCDIANNRIAAQMQGGNPHTVPLAEAGTCTLNGASPPTCTFTFAKAFNSVPICTATPTTSGTFTAGSKLTVNPGTSSVVLNESTNTDSAVIDIVCLGNPY